MTKTWAPSGASCLAYAHRRASGAAASMSTLPNVMAYSALSQKVLPDAAVYKLEPMKGPLISVQMPKTGMFCGALNSSAALSSKT